MVGSVIEGKDYATQRYMYNKIILLIIMKRIFYLAIGKTLVYYKSL